MYLYHRNKYFHNLKKKQLAELNDRVDEIIQDRSTVQKDITDFAEINKYLDKKFPNIDTSDVKIYLVEPYCMKKHGFNDCGGCYIDFLKCILAKNRIVTMSGTKWQFERLMKRYSTKLDVEDVIVHEMIHAVSAAANRGGAGRSKYTFEEEEFVYTNSVDFYKEKGMKEQEIVNSVFLPFCVYDIVQDQSEMNKICTKQRITRSKGFMNIHASVLVPIIVKKAREMGLHMIDLHKEYGCQLLAVEPPTNNASKRFSSIDFDC